MPRDATHRLRLAAVALVALGVWRAAIADMAGGLIANSSFELVEPPPPTSESARRGGAVPPEQMLPRGWDMLVQGEATATSPADAGLAHSGSRCLRLEANRGQAIVRYGPMPLPDARPWQITFWARGTGTLVCVAHEFRPDRASTTGETTWALSAHWTRHTHTFAPPADWRTWHLALQTRGRTEAWIDDVTAGYEGLQPLPLPPSRPVERDGQTLLYLPFEEPLDEYAFFVKGPVHLSGTEVGKFGRALVFGPESYVAGAAEDHLNPTSGTIEVWCRFQGPGNNGLSQNIVSVPGPDGMWFGKDQYGHVSLAFSSGWRRLAGATAMGYAHSWQPGVWRHFAACWDREALQVFVDGKLIAWQTRPQLLRMLGPELRLGSPGLELDDLRISAGVRYRVPVAPDAGQ